MLNAMLIIDEYADSKLIQTLETLRSQPNANMSRLIHFKLSAQAKTRRDATEMNKHVVASAQQYIASTNPQIYLCEDGDIFVLTPALPGKDARQMMLDVATQLQIPATDEFAGFYELNPHVNKLLTLVEQKIEKRRQEAETIQKQREAQRAERKRQAILNYSDLGQRTHDIAARRSLRSKPELMIIEDDIFSRRLVENVLQKQYPLTALATAELALATYARLAPDMLFLDINLPDVSGHELLGKILALDPQAYVIMLSGNCNQSNIVQAMQHGAKGFIAKPFTRDKLLQYIDRCPTIKH